MPYAVIKEHQKYFGQLSDVLVMQGGGSVSVPLPAHKMSPHDVVELRPSKGDASLAAIANGIVHRHASSAGSPDGPPACSQQWLSPKRACA